MVINHIEKLFVTSDAATIVKELEIAHPAANMVVLATKQQEEEIGDGANLCVVFAGELLFAAASLIRMGLHVSEIVKVGVGTYVYVSLAYAQMPLVIIIVVFNFSVLTSLVLLLIALYSIIFLHFVFFFLLEPGVVVKSFFYISIAGLRKGFQACFRAPS
jgi:hypothetical protein